MLSNSRVQSRGVTAATALGIVLVLVVGALLARHQLALSSYKSFYCAGKVLLEHGNPYLVEPLRTCEHRIYQSHDFPAYAVEPAPLPPYALAGFALFALLPPGGSHAVYLVCLLAALFLTVWALASIAKFSPALVLLVCLPAWLLNAAYGEIPPVAVAAIALCGLALSRNRPVAAAIAACVSMIEPHIGLPLCVALFIFAARTRIVLLAGGLVAIAVSVLAVGIPATAAYFSTYLPGQARSEIAAADQYSLTNLLHMLHVPNGAALALGSLSYIVLAAAGIVAARSLSEHWNERAFIAFTPPAFVLFAGTFVHDIQMFAAVPLALLILAKRPGYVVAGLALALTALVWDTGASRLSLVVDAAAIVGIVLLVFGAGARAWPKAAALGIALLGAVVLFSRLPARAIGVSAAPASMQISANDSASVPWQAYVTNTPVLAQPTLRSEGRKVPTWIGLALLISLSLGMRQPKRAAAGIGAERPHTEAAAAERPLPG
jgi:hypothetical protein